MKLFISAIVVVGAVRFALSVSGVPDQIVKFVSMTVIILAGTFYFSIVSSSHKERLKDAYLLILPYMLVEVFALGFTWATGRRTIFHTAEYSFGTSLPVHTLGHLIGGLTWEPLSIFVIMEIIRGIYAGGRVLLGRSANPV